LIIAERMRQKIDVVISVNVSTLDHLLIGLLPLGVLVDRDFWTSMLLLMIIIKKLELHINVTRGWC